MRNSLGQSHIPYLCEVEETTISSALRPLDSFSNVLATWPQVRVKSVGRTSALTHQDIKMSVPRLLQQRTYMLMTDMKTFIIVYSLLPFIYSLSDGYTQVPAGQNLSLSLLHRY